ncbi:HMG1/2-like protein isoform X2 [Cornus florida]|uniref:HMG1/2-like protein isoform X2 n=1 Tax=Cornus florida TaxID=4283 RepID=UPI00289AA6D4|nr:HMG1/2-like protein isoform X2 [Cornus florida]
MGEEFRKQFKEKNPNNKSVSVVGKAGGVKWKSMSDAEKAPYVSKADKRKKDYKKNMDAYNKKLAQGTNASEDKNEESDKSRSEANDEDDEGSEGSGEVEDSEYFWWILYDWRALLVFGGFLSLALVTAF